MADYNEETVWELMNKASALMEEFIKVTGLEYDWDEDEMRVILYEIDEMTITEIERMLRQ